MLQRLFILFLLFFSFSIGFGQKVDSLSNKIPGVIYEQNDSVKIIRIEEERQFGLLLSYQLGKFSYGEVGAAFVANSFWGHHPTSAVAFVSTEFRIGSDFILGPKIGVWFSGGVAPLTIGLNTIYYTDFDDGALVFRPEIGIGLSGLKLVYGYNWNLTNKEFRGINSNFVGLTYILPLKRKKLFREIKMINK
jgi:hypothetical protein